jgi:hypothetical protein
LAGRRLEYYTPDWRKSIRTQKKIGSVLIQKFFADVGVPPLGGLLSEPDRLKPGHQQAAL